jgi:hypothetical protein
MVSISEMGAAVGVGVTLWLSRYFWLWILGAVGLALTVHFIWRWKTRSWTQSWWGWNDLEAADGSEGNNTAGSRIRG